MSADIVFKAKLAEQSERYEDMVTFMKNVATTSEESLGLEERNLLSVAYKNVIGSRRSAWRALSSLHAATANRKDDSSELRQIEAYRSKVESELDNLCNEVLGIISEHLLPKVGNDTEANVFFLKMAGDYHRYLAEFKSGDEHTAAGNSAAENYSKATDIAKALSSTHPIRLGLALNYSVMMYEIQGEKDNACATAKAAFDDAIAELDQLEEDSYKDATLIMQLLRDNLTLWTNEDAE